MRRILRRICSGPKPCKLHVKIASKIHHKNPLHSSPHARLVCDYTLPAFFTACFAACPSTYYIMLHGGFLPRRISSAADFLRGGFLTRRSSSAADFFLGGFLPWLQVAICHELHIRRDRGHMQDMGSSYQIGYAAMVVFQMSVHLASVLCHVSKISKRSTPNFCTPSRDEYCETFVLVVLRTPTVFRTSCSVAFKLTSLDFQIQ